MCLLKISWTAIFYFCQRCLSLMMSFPLCCHSRLFVTLLINEVPFFNRTGLQSPHLIYEVTICLKCPINQQSGPLGCVWKCWKLCFIESVLTEESFKGTSQTFVATAFVIRTIWKRMIVKTICHAKKKFQTLINHWIIKEYLFMGEKKRADIKNNVMIIMIIGTKWKLNMLATICN